MQPKYSILYIFILGAINFLSSQEYFNRIIPFDIGNPNPVELLINGNNLVLSCIHDFGPENKGATTFIIVNEDISSYSHITSEGYLISRNSPFVSENGFIIFGNKDKDERSLSFAKYNSDFDLIDSIDFDTPSGDNFMTCSTFFNGSIYGVSNDDYDRTGDWQRQVTVLKTDTDGQLIWSENIGFNERYTLAWDITNSHDNKLIISTGVSRYDSLGRYADLRKMDSNGNVIWHTEGDEEMAHGAVPTWIATLSDSSIVQSYFLDKRNDQAWPLNQYPFPPKLLWYDKDGNPFLDTLIISEQYDAPYITQLKEGRGDYFFGYGKYDIQVGDPVLQEATGWLFKMSNSGEMIWSKRYRHPEYLTRDGQHIINDIVEMENGDIIMLGRLNNVGSPSEVWLLKVNEHGCYGEETCGDEVITSSYDILNTDIPNINIYPNPSNGIFNFSLHDDIKIKQLRIMDMTGRLISQERGFDIDQFDLSNLVSGVYFVTMDLNNNKILTNRIIVK